MNTGLFNKCLNFNFQGLFQQKGYKYFSSGKYNLNFIGVRSTNSVIQSNTFDDIFVCIYNDKNMKTQRVIIPITTDPGLYYLKTPLSKDGTAILKPGQYPGVWKIGLHQGKYEALVQKKEFVVYRDKDKDNILDFDETSTQYGIYGINFHKAGANSQIVENWSAGCQVCQRESDFLKIMKLANEAVKLYDNSFTYTLLNEKDLI